MSIHSLTWSQSRDERHRCAANLNTCSRRAGWLKESSVCSQNTAAIYILTLSSDFECVSSECSRSFLFLVISFAHCREKRLNLDGWELVDWIISGATEVGWNRAPRFFSKVNITCFHALIPHLHHCFIVKVNNFRGDLTDASAKKSFTNAQSVAYSSALWCWRSRSIVVDKKDVSRHASLHYAIGSASF